MRLRERPVESHPAQWGRGAHPGSKGGSRRVHYAALRSKLYNHLWLFPPLIQHTASLMNAYYVSVQFSSVQSLSRVWLFATAWTAARQASLSSTNSWSSLKVTSIELVMPSSHLVLCRPLLLLPPIPLSIRVFSTVLLIELQTLSDFYHFSHSCPFAINIQPRLTYLINCCLLSHLQPVTVT